MKKLEAIFDPGLMVRVICKRKLFYSAGADPGRDRPGHVRAGSGLCWLSGRIAVIEDDANFIALTEPDGPEVEAVELPPGEAGRRVFDDGLGNKRFKLDLEACASVETPAGTLFLALGSGSTPAREQVARAPWPLPPGGELPVQPAPEFYRALRERKDFSGSELNLEGAAVDAAGELMLFQRGNGAPAGDLEPVNATARGSLKDFLLYLDGRAGTPVLHDVFQYELGRIAGVPLTFTDAAPGPGGRVLYLAGAEASPDAAQDGEVKGAAVGVIHPGGQVRYTVLRDESGRVPEIKAEGLLLDPARPGRAFAAIDRDDPNEPTELWELELDGPWW